jgi:phosphopantetheinyl transferase (holo-ACP synthase)
MPICYKLNQADFILGLWEITESLIELLDLFSKTAPKNEFEKVGNFKNPQRKMEWISTRLLLYDLLNKSVSIKYTENGKPILENENHDISVSHTKGMVAVIIANNMAGIDIEKITDRVLRIENRFLSSIEKRQISDNDRIEQLLAYWSAKETLYKISGAKYLNFKKNLYINPFPMGKNGNFTGEVIINNQSIAYRLNYFIFDKNVGENNFLIVYYYN